MKMKKITAIILSASMLLHAGGMVFAATTTESEYSGEYQAFDQISKYISDLYIDPYTKEEVMAKGLSELLDGNNALLVKLLKATLESMDDYSEFYTEAEYKEFVEQLNKTFYGIGILMQQNGTDYVEVTGFSDNTDNAVKAGFELGDKIVKVNGIDVTGMRLSEVRELVIGEEGTEVNITVLRDDKEIDLTATRVAVNASTVLSSVLEGDIGYIMIESFSTDTASEFKKALESMRENNVKKIILDLRNNGGGLVSSAVDIAETIVPKGKIIDVKYRQSSNNVTHSSTLAKKEFDFKVLVNERTASAAEILASALQDSKAGELIGTQTFGKAVIQNTFPLTNGSVFKLTVGEYITRNGKKINHQGLTPDVVVENEKHKLDTSKLTQFDYKTRTALGEKSDNVKAAKERLYYLRIYGGDESDIYDEELFYVIKDFQIQNSILGYGILDVPTQQLLEEKAAEIDVTDDLQFDTAYEKFGGKVD